MKQILILLFILPISLWGQTEHRTYMKVGSYGLHDDMYVTKDVNGEYHFHIQLWNMSHFDDSVFMVLNEVECEQMMNALTKLNSTYRRWSSAAHLHKVKDYIRPMDIEFPQVTFQWRTIMEVFPGRPVLERSYRQTGPTDFPQPYFKVDKEGRCSIAMCTMLPEATDGDTEYELSMHFASSSLLRDLIKRCNSTWAIAEYEQEHRPRTKEFYDSIFR